MSKFSIQNIQYKKIYMLQLFFYLFLSFFLIALNEQEILIDQYYLFFCFFIIATIGISHGSLDNEKGEFILKKIFPRYWSFIFYGAYILTSLFVLIAWIYWPLTSLCIFFLVASFHFGYEDLEMFFDQRFFFEIPFYFTRGLIVISTPLYLNNIETVNFIDILLLGKNWINLEFSTYGYIFYLNLLLIFALSFLFLIKKTINFKDFLIIGLEVLSIVVIFKYLPLIMAFTMYFCFMHSTKHIMSLAMELGRDNMIVGIKKFTNKAMPLTIITFGMSLIMLFYLSKDFSVDKSILKIIFIGLASLTLPHIILEYIYAKNKRS